MSTISKIANGSLKSNKSKSILIAITIALTTTLLTAIGITCANWAEMNKQITIERSGSFHGIYKKATIDNLKVIKSNIDIDEFGLSRTIGASGYEDSSLILGYIDENAKTMSNLKLLEGKMPINIDDVAIQDGYLKLLGKEAKVGDKIKIQYESRLTGDIKEKEFNICGLIEATDFNIVNKSYSAIISDKFLEKEESADNIEFNAYIRVKGDEKLTGNEIEDKVKSVAKDIGINEYDVKINEDYINATNPDMSVIGGAIAIVIIIILSSALVIYSIFYVSIISKVQEFGKLRAVGATKKQIKAVILREGIILATISILVGLLLGYFIGDVLIQKLLLMNEYNVGGFSLPIIIGAAVISYFTVFISLLKPMKVASKISPVEAMRYNGGENSKKKTREGYSYINIKRLTYANLSRNKKRTAITLASLGLSGILFMTMSTVMSSMNAEQMARGHMKGEFSLGLTNYTYGNEDEPLATDYNMVQENNPLGKEFRDKLMKIPGVKEIITSGSAWIDYEVPSGEMQRSNIGAFKNDDIKELEEKIVEGEIDYESLKNGDSVIYTYPSYAEENGIKVGEKVSLTIYDGSNKFTKEFTVAAISYVGGDEFLVPEKVLDNLIKTDITSFVDIIVDKNDKKLVEENLKSMVEGEAFIEFNSIDDEIEVYENALTLTKTLGYPLVIIIGVIGFMNLINTMITSIITRKRELGMLQAIGLSNRQLVRMLQIEGLFYTAGTLGITLTLGNIVGYIAFLVFKNSGASYAVYRYPLIPTIILVLSVLVGQLILTYIVSSNFNKESLIDRVRYSE